LLFDGRGRAAARYATQQISDGFGFPPSRRNANATQNLCLNFNQDERERKALLDKFLGEVQNRVSGRAFPLSFPLKK